MEKEYKTLRVGADDSDYARVFLYENYNDNLIYDGDEWYFYNKTFWKKIKSLEVQKQIQYFFGETYKYKYTVKKESSYDENGCKITKDKKVKTQINVSASFVENVFKSLRIKVFNGNFFKDVTPGFALKDCFISLHTDGYLINDHDPKFKNRHILNCFYDEQADTKPLLNYFDSLFNTLPDKNDVVNYLLTYLSACMSGVAAKKIQTSVWLLGDDAEDGSNGKSTLSEFISGIFPKEMVSHLSPDLWSGFNLINLDGKLLNMVTELPAISNIKGEKFKAVITGDEITTEVKYKDNKDLNPVCGHIFSCNKFPSTHQVDGAFWRRIVILPCINIFDKKSKDPNILDKLLSEQNMSAFVNILIGKFIRLLDDNFKIEEPASSIQYKQFEKKQEDFELWFDENVENTNRGDWLSAVEVYSNYKNYCVSFNYKPLTNITFSKRLKRKGINNKRSNGIKYEIKLNPTW